MTNSQTSTSQAVMAWLFKLNLGVLFAAFSAISFWTQGVPRKLATLAGFVAGFLFLGFLAVDFFIFQIGKVSRPLTGPLVFAMVWLLALVCGWPLVTATAANDWGYQHESRAILCGVAWSLQAIFWIAVCYPSFRALPSPWLNAFAETSMFAGLILQFLAATLIAGAPWMWPAHTREQVVDWYVWTSQGYGMSLLVSGALVTQLFGEGPHPPLRRWLPGLILLVVSFATFWKGMHALPLVRGLAHGFMICGYLQPVSREA